jgi:hypothetical protein
VDACDTWRAALTEEEIRALGWKLVNGGWRKHFGHVPVVVFSIRGVGPDRSGVVFRLVYETDGEEHVHHGFGDLWSAVDAAERRFREGVSEDDLLRAWLSDELAARVKRLRIYRDGQAWRHPDYGQIARPHGSWWIARVRAGGNDLFPTLPKMMEALCDWVEYATRSRGAMSIEYRPPVPANPDADGKA